MSHTYTAHITFGARNDEEAAMFMAFKKQIECWLGAWEFPLTPNGYYVDSVHITDADDWGEHVNVEPLDCYVCMKPLNRNRSGTGSRTCADHPGKSPQGYVYPNYPIEDVRI